MMKIYNKIFILLLCVMIAVDCFGIGNANDTCRYEFVNDTVSLDEAEAIGTIVYTEHKSKVNMVLTYVFPIVMLLLGVGIDRLIVRLTERKRINKNGRRWIYELRSSIGPIKEQQKELQRFIDDTERIKSTAKYNSLAIYSEINGDIYNYLNKEDLYEYIEGILKGKTQELDETYHDILKCVNVLKSLNERIIKSFDDYVARAGALVQECNDKICEYQKKFNLMYHKCDIRYKVNFDKLNALLMYQYEQKLPMVNLFELPKSFIAPSIEILSNSNYEECSDLIEILATCMYKISGLSSAQKCVTDDFRDYIQAYDNLIKYIEKVCVDCK